MSGKAPDTSLHLGAERRKWLQDAGGIQATINRLIDQAIEEEIKMSNETITASKTPAGWKLTNSQGQDVQEGFCYPSKWQAMEACRKLWPANSVWHGRPGNGGWVIYTEV